MNKAIIGRKELVGLPDWSIDAIVAKVDTGAYNCAIHADAVIEQTEQGQSILEFVLLPVSEPAFSGKKIRTTSYQVKNVRNSFGQMEKRFLVHTRLVLGAQSIPVAFTLSNRSKMKHAVLLGRKMLKNRFLVDVAKTYQAGKPLTSTQP
ncbi:ATP-dependent zinc protease [Cyclobacterium xiamenense]|uniref:ATP-dependent zinc protease family protein n=1 Tax=Cyclobacterium xiamenense TaxID=1297121 RepID=UPI0035CFBD04